MNWDRVRLFLEVAEAGSLIAAAERLGVSQPTLGRQIDRLEREIGVTLFQRGRTGMALTEAGLALVDDGRDMAAAAGRLRLTAEGAVASVSGPVRITASDVVSSYLLPEILVALKDAEPAIDIELVASNQVENLLLRDADIAVRMVRPTQNDLIAAKVNNMAMGTYAHRDYLARHGTPKTIEQLYDHRIVGYDRADLILRTMAELGLTGGREMFAFRTDDQVAYWELVKAGAGIGFGPRLIATRSPELIEVVEGLAIPALPMWLASHRELHTSARIRFVVDFLGQALRALPLSR